MEILLNRDYLYKIRPERIVLLAVLFLAVCFIIGPINPQNTLTIQSSAYIVLCLTGFWIGTGIVKSRKLPDAKIQINKSRVLRLYWLSFILGLTGVLLRFYDLFAVRNLVFLLSDDASSDILGGGGTLISIVSGVMVFFSYIPVTLDNVIPLLHKAFVRFISTVAFFFTAATILVDGSRFSMVIPLLYYLYLMGYSKKLTMKLSKKNLLKYLFLVVFLGYLIGGVYVIRMNINDQDPAQVVQKSGYTKFVPASDWYSELLKTYKDSWFLPHLFAFSNIIQYETHAILEFPDVMDNVDKKGAIFYGGASFSLIAKVLLKITGSNYDMSEDVNEKYNLRPGIWSTFFYTWYLDFRWFGILIMFIIGVFSKVLWRIVYFKGNIFFIPIILVFNIIWMFTFSINMFAGRCSYALFVFILVPFISQKILISKSTCLKHR